MWFIFFQHSHGPLHAPHFGDHWSVLEWQLVLQFYFVLFGRLKTSLFSIVHNSYCISGTHRGCFRSTETVSHSVQQISKKKHHFWVTGKDGEENQLWSVFTRQVVQYHLQEQNLSSITFMCWILRLRYMLYCNGSSV